MAEKLDFDPYELLQVGDDAQEKEIVSAYRKQALKWHPDKNPERRELAQAMFLKVTKALEILTDAAAKAAYGRLRAARRVARERNRQLDAKRRRLRDELEARESAVGARKDDEQRAAARLEREIERLRKEGSALLRRERDAVERAVHADAASAPADPSAPPPCVRVRWSAAADDAANGGYDVDCLRDIFSRYGQVGAVVVSSKRNGSAIVEFRRPIEPDSGISSEKGLAANRLRFTWVSGEPADKAVPSEPSAGGECRLSPPWSVDAAGASASDFESVVLTRLRQAEERKRLIEEMQSRDADHV